MEGPLLSSAQDNYYKLVGEREKLRGTQNLASERARFLAEEVEEARSSGRDPEVMEQEARSLRQEESVLRGELTKSQNELADASKNVAELEGRVRIEEDRVSAALRAIADHREGTARQEGHIKSLQSAIDGAKAELSRLERALGEARDRVEVSRREFASLESEIAGLDASESNPNSILLLDRNLVTNSWNLRGKVLLAFPTRPPAWDGSQHKLRGNLALSDGSVQQVTLAGLSNQVAQAGIATNHLLLPLLP